MDGLILIRFALRCLPRLGTGAITTFCRNELRVFQGLSHYSTERLNETPLVVVFAFVEPKRLLIAVSKQMKRLNINVRSFESAFQKRPEVFKSVSMNFTACIAFKVVDYLTVVILFQIVIGVRFHVVSLAQLAVLLGIAGDQCRQFGILCVLERGQDCCLRDVTEPDNGVMNSLFHGLCLFDPTKEFRAGLVACAYRFSVKGN